MVELVHEERSNLAGLEARPLAAHPEPRLGEMARQDARVVPEAPDHRREARHAVLAQAGCGVADVPGEEDAGHGDALPERPDRRQPPVAHCRDAERREVAHRRLEPGRGDDVVRLEQERFRPRRVERVDDEPVPSALDPVDRGVQDEASGGASHVLVVRRQVPRAER